MVTHKKEMAKKLYSLQYGNEKNVPMESPEEVMKMYGKDWEFRRVDVDICMKAVILSGLKKM